MATDFVVAPFPPNLDRNTFGHWLSGFTDGEGCFYLRYHIPRERSPEFKTRFIIDRIEDLHGVVVPHFDRYPLHAKKARDFIIWRQGIELVYSVSRRKIRSLGFARGTRPRWEPHEVQQFIALDNALREQRRYAETIT